MASSLVPLGVAPCSRWRCAVPAGNTYLCLAVLDGVLCVIFLHGRNSPQSSPSSTPRLLKSLSFELQPSDLIEKPMSPMQYARSGLGTAELHGKLIAAGELGQGHRSRAALVPLNVGPVTSRLQGATTGRSACAPWSATTPRRTPGRSSHP